MKHLRSVSFVLLLISGFYAQSFAMEPDCYPDLALGDSNGDFSALDECENASIAAVCNWGCGYYPPLGANEWTQMSSWSCDCSVDECNEDGDICEPMCIIDGECWMANLD